MGLVAQDILVHGIHLVVAKEVEGKVVDLCYITADKHVGSQQRPQRDMRILFVRREPAVAEMVAPAHLPHHQHIRIVPVSGARIGIELRLTLEANVIQRLPGIGNVAGRPPGVGIHGVAPGPDIGHAVLAERIENVARLLAEIFLHLQVRTNIGSRRFVGLRTKYFAVAAPVIFQVIHTPAVPGLCILLLVIQRAQISATGAVARAGVDAQFQSVGVQPVS